MIGVQIYKIWNKIGSKRNKKISNKLIGRKADWMKKRSKPIIQYDLNMNKIQEWPSAIDACLSLEKNPKSSALSECCNNKRKTAYGFIWKFK